MSVSTTNVSEVYAGNGSSTVFPITFQFIANAQIKVKKLVVSTQVETILAEGVDYTLTGGDPDTGGDPATDVTMTLAPASGEQITVCRETALLQNTEFIYTGAVPGDTVEEQFDYCVMMLQELSAAFDGAGITVNNAPSTLALQSVADSSTVLATASSQEIVGLVQGGTAGANTSTTSIEDGTVVWQKLKLIGQSDTQTLTLDSGANLAMNGPLTFVQNTVLDLIWDETNTKWIETGRRN